MAFVGTPLVAPQRAAQTRACATEPPAKVSRRGALRAAAGVALGLAAAAAGGRRGDFDALALRDLSEIKKDVEAIKYEEEVLDIGPDPEEKLIIRQKRPKKENPAVVAQTAREQKEAEEYKAMLEREKEEAARVKALFSKKS